MRFSSELREFANKYRKTHFNSDDVSDKTDIWASNWDEVEKKAGQAVGGQYLAVHLRRKDFLRARAKVLSPKFSEINLDYRNCHQYKGQSNKSKNICKRQTLKRSLSPLMVSMVSESSSKSYLETPSFSTIPQQMKVLLLLVKPIF